MTVQHLDNITYIFTRALVNIENLREGFVRPLIFIIAPLSYAAEHSAVRQRQYRRRLCANTADRFTTTPLINHIIREK